MSQNTPPEAGNEPYTEGAPDLGTEGVPAAIGERSGPRTGPIVWGAIVLAICVYVAAQAFAPGSLDATGFVIAGVIGLGLLLLLVGVVVLVRNSRKQ